MRSLPYACLSGLLCMTLIACDKKTEQVRPDEAPKAPAVVRRPDTAPQLEFKPVVSPEPTAVELELGAEAFARDADHLYVRFPAQRWQGVIPSAFVDGSTSAMAPVFFVSRQTGQAVPWLRLKTKTLPTTPMSLHVRISPFRYQRAVEQQVNIKATFSPSLAEQPEVRAEFYQGLSSHFETRAFSHPFYAYAQARAKILEGTTKGAPASNANNVRQPRRLNDVDELMSLYTGATSVREALQYDRGLLLRADAQPRDVPIKDIKTAPLAQHPWPTMIKELGREPVIEPLAAFVPADFIYMHFHDLRELVKLAADIDSWGTPAIRMMEGDGANAEFLKRYERQLILERTSLSETLGHVAAKGVALACSDPFLREGADVSILFHLNNKTMIASALDAFIVKAKTAHPDLVESSYAIDGIGVRLFKTPDRRLERHQLELADVLIVTNSRAAAERFVKVHKKSVKALSDSGDFRYMRTLYPYDTKAESGFVFIGDDLVAHAISPQVKIGQARRMEAQADPTSISYASMLYAGLEGQRPKDVQALTSAGYLLPEELTHSNGDAIAYDPLYGPSSAAWGRLDALTPLIELNVTSATKAEQQAYERFLATYQSYWRGFIDPIAARIKRSEDGKALSLDARMLPIIDGSDYRELMRTVGQNIMQPGAPVGGAEMTFAIGQDASIRRELDRAAFSLSRRSDLNLGWLGDFITVGVDDRNALIDLATALTYSANGDNDVLREQLEKKSISEIDVLATMPFFALIDVRNVVGLASVLTSVRGFINDAAPGMIVWGEGAPYREIKTVTIAEELRATGRPGKTPFMLHYATVQGRWVVTLRRDVLEAQIDAVLDGRASAPVEQAKKQEAMGKLPLIDSPIAQTSFMLRPWDKDSAIARALQILSVALISQEAAAITQTYELLHFGMGHDLPKDDAEIIAFSLGHLGAAPAKVGADKPTYDATHHVFIFSESALSPERSSVASLISTLHTLQMSLSFEGQDTHRGIHTQLSWVRR